MFVNPATHVPQRPHAGVEAPTTRSPTCTDPTPGPTSTTLPGRFVAQHDRGTHHADAGTEVHPRLHHVAIAGADSAGADLDEHLAVFGRLSLDLFDHEVHSAGEGDCRPESEWAPHRDTTRSDRSVPEIITWPSAMGRSLGRARGDPPRRRAGPGCRPWRTGSGRPRHQSSSSSRSPRRHRHPRWGGSRSTTPSESRIRTPWSAAVAT